MKKILVVTLTLIMALGFIGCSKSPAKIISDGLLNHIASKSGESQTVVDLSLSLEDGSSSKNMTLTSNSKFFKDKYSGNYTGDLEGLKFEGDYQGDENVIHFTSPFIKEYLDTDYVSIDMENHYKNRNIDIIKLNERNKKANYEFGKYIFQDIGIENLLVVSEGVDEEITVNGASQKVKKYNAKVNHETIKENSIKILEYIVNNSEILEVLKEVNGEGYKENYLRKLNKAILKIKDMSDEDYAIEYEKIKPYIEALEIDFYVFKGDIVRQNIKLNVTERGVVFDLNINTDYFNLGKVEDFTIEAPQSTWNIMSIFDTDLSTNGKILKTAMMKNFDIPESAEYNFDLNMLTSYEREYSENPETFNIKMSSTGKYLFNKLISEIKGSYNGITSSAKISSDREKAVVESDLLLNVSPGLTSIVADFDKMESYMEEKSSIAKKQEKIDPEEIKSEIFDKLKYFIEEPVDLDKESLAEMKAYAGLWLQTIKYIGYEFDLENVFVLDGPTQETLKLGNDEIKTTKISGHVTVTKSEAIIEDVIEKLMKNKEFYNAANVISSNEFDSYEAYLTEIEDLKASFKEDLEESSDEIQRVEAILDDIILTVYADETGRAVKTNVDFNLDMPEVGVKTKGQITFKLFNLGKVQDFEITVPEDAMDFIEFMKMMEEQNSY